MKIKLHEKVVGHDRDGNELKVFYIKRIELVEQLLADMLHAVRSEMQCKN